MGKPFRLTEKSQVTVPKDAREALGIGPGDEIEYEIEGDRVVMRRAAVVPVDEEEALRRFRVKLEKARRHATPLPLGMTTDDYMALIREPLPPYDA